MRYYHEENKDVHEEQRLRIEELDEWREHKSRTHDKLKLRKHKPDTSPNQLQVGDTVLLDAVDPHIVTTTPNEEIPLTILSIFPFGMMEVSHPKFGTFKVPSTTRPVTWSWLRTCVPTQRETQQYDTAVQKQGVRHARAVKPWTTIHGRGTLTWAREKRTQLGTAVPYGRVPHTPKKHGLGIVAKHELKLQNSKHTGSTS
ncbi:hypothetical protein GOBAR_AA19290 [Gossypium barbadense]|uniref:Uncharacterized protein n=1 Tax=Gossypium barbadense TaxID=3634 RepID=A0A2P5XDE5_GOSBA|nr:hypothetical protein GOBAR_AA19290 [Gossypium barbadense]